MTDVYAPDLYPKRRRKMCTPERDKYLRDNATVDPALLANDLGITERAVISYQRRLGVRRMTGGHPRKYFGET